MENLVQRRLIERLLQGERRESDIARLFLHAREHAYFGSESVREIGNFVAHSGDRTQGFVTQSAKDLYSIVHFKFKHLNIDIDATKLDPEFKNFLLATFNRLDLKSFGRKDSSKSERYKAIKSLCEKMRTNTDGSFTLINNSDNSWLINELEYREFSTLTQVMILKPAFTGEELFRDFSKGLKRSGLILESEVREFKKLSSFVQLFAIAAMHRSNIKINDNSSGFLSADLDDGHKTGYLVTSIFIELIKDGNPLTVGTTLYTTKLRSDDYCTSSLIRAENISTLALEVKENGRLGLL